MAKKNYLNKNLEKNKNGYWYYVKTHKKKRLKESLKTRDVNEARLFRDKYNAHLELYGELPRGADNEDQVSSPSWHDACEEWYESKINQCEITTLKSYRDVLNSYLFKVPFLNEPINQITKKEINHWWRSLKLNPNTINNNFTYMSNIFDFAIDEEWTSDNPMQNVKRPKSIASNIDPYELEQVEVLLDNAKGEKDEDYLCGRFFSGLRGQEIDALEIHHVDPTEPRLKVEQAIVDRILKDPKNESSCRSVYLSKRAYEAFKRQVERARLRKPKLFSGQLAFRKNTKQNSNLYRHFLFVNRNGDPFSFRTVRRTIWKPIFEKEEVKKRFISYRNLHQTRHTYISQCLLAGENLLWVSKQAGHSNATTTLKRYARWIKNDNDGKKTDAIFTQSLHKYSSDKTDL